MTQREKKTTFHDKHPECADELMEQALKAGAKGELSFDEVKGHAMHRFYCEAHHRIGLVWEAPVPAE